MPSSNLAFTGFFVIAIAILAMDYAQDYFEGIFDIQPELIRRSNPNRHNSLTTTSATLYAEKSPLFQALKMRYKEFTPSATDIKVTHIERGDHHHDVNDYGLKERYMQENLRGNKST